ncbi:DsbA family protein [Brachybacterium hainanense]|uniref:DsbA family protein n=1 Tax=Brachybacterium hainanense TaxID=1541174 RepID=A0ABV6R814_9MICO
MTPPPAPPGRSKAPLIIGIICAVTAVAAFVIGGIGVVAYLVIRNAEPDAPTASGPAPSTDAAVLETDHLHFGTDSAASPEVELYIDFACPHCADFAEINDPDLRQLSEDGMVNLKIRPLPMLNASSAGYSERAASAATCMYAQDPALFWDMSEALFAQQAEGPSLTSEDLADLAEGLGADEDTAACIAADTYTGWVNDTVYPPALERISGTPSVYLDGEQWTGDYTVPGELHLAIVGE